MGLVSSRRYDPLPERLNKVEPFVRALFEELEARCAEEKQQYASWATPKEPQKEGRTLNISNKNYLLVGTGSH